MLDGTDTLDCTGMADPVAELDALIRSLHKRHTEHNPTSPLAFFELEQAAHELGGQLADLLVAQEILVQHLDRRFVKQANKEGSVALLEEHPRFNKTKHMGSRAVTVQLANGLRLSLRTPYLRVLYRGLPGRPRGTGRRGGTGTGIYPVLVRLGLLDRVTPLVRSMVSRQVVLSGSILEAQGQLAEQGLHFDDAKIIRLAVSTGVRGLLLRDLAFEEARTRPLSDDSMVEGLRLRLCIDGGRARVRTPQRGAPVGKNGRRPFSLDWREPRLITLDVLDEAGRKDPRRRLVTESVVGDADEVFRVTLCLLRHVGAHRAAHIQFISDGAKWIWERLPGLFADAGVPLERTRLILDFFHAAEYISDALKACKNLGNDERTSLFRELRRRLLEPGGAQVVVARLSEFARGRRAKLINKKVAYLEGHIDHMDYARQRADQLPIGSGVVESAVRRNLNMRFKGASICWIEEHLKALLSLRTVSKTGHWDDFMRAWLQGEYWIGPGVFAPTHQAVEAEQEAVSEEVGEKAA